MKVATPWREPKRNSHVFKEIITDELKAIVSPLPVTRGKKGGGTLGKMQRDKGARFERLIANLFKDWGYNAFRTAQYEGKSGNAADVEGVPGLHIECKHVEKMHLYEWMAQADRDNKASKHPQIPVVIHKANNKPILVSMHIEDFIQLYKEWEASDGA